ncbi:aminotransferase class V-fold PLP-dependent enzyme [bacterium]|nr:aminotransferase class V-fold PLP-dependent enzyme [bacterium]
MFETSSKAFPVKDYYIFLNSCGVSPLHQAALEALIESVQRQALHGIKAFEGYHELLRSIHTELGKILQANPSDISILRNTAECLSVVAQGLVAAQALVAGDEVVTYEHEYPSNFYPWKYLERNGIVLKIIPDLRIDPQRPHSFSYQSVVQALTAKTKLLALSHVQFTSGFACDIARIAELCAERGIDFVVDAAQSLGALPIYPEALKISAIAAPSSKWLIGPSSLALLYTSPKFRQKLAPVLTGQDMMKQGVDYLNLTLDPHPDGRMFEYSTIAPAELHGFEVTLKQIFSGQKMEAIRDRIFSLQDKFLTVVDRKFYQPVLFPDKINRSGILSFVTKTDPVELMKEIIKRGVFVSSRGGYLRFAPQMYITEEEVIRAGQVWNEAAFASC